MANLLSDADGRGLLLRSLCFLGRRRMSRHFKRSFMIAYDQWKTTGEFSLETLLNALNPTDQNEILEIGNLMSSMGCFENATTQDLTIWVDGTNGSDTSGSGSLGNPYQTLSFLQDRLFPSFINHHVRILLLSDVTSANAISFDQIVGPGGSLTVAGVGPAKILTTSAGVGPFTLGAGSAFHSSPYEAVDFDSVDTFGIDELYGKWILFRTGQLAGQTIPVHDNSANNIWTRSGWDYDAVAPVFPGAGDTFQIVDPPVRLTVPALTSKLSGPSANYSSDFRASLFALLNLTVDTSDTEFREDKFHISNDCHSLVSFVTIERNSSFDNHNRISSALNYRQSVDPDAIALLSTDVSNLNIPYSTNIASKTCSGILFHNTPWPPVSTGVIELIIDARPNDFMAAMDVRARTLVRSGSEIQGCGFGTLEFQIDGTINLERNYLSGKPTGSTISLDRGGLVEIRKNFFRGGEDCITVGICDGILNDNHISAGAAYSGHGMAIFGIGRIWIQNAPVLTGTTGDLYYPTGGTNPWPPVNNTEPNGLGSFVTWV